MPADPAGHGGCRLCRLAGRRMGQYAHLQQCARLVILALILGDLIPYQNDREDSAAIARKGRENVSEYSTSCMDMRTDEALI
ncbi:MAG: hypothetical protein ACLQB1_28735, partial [Streptosporangiaceae bacterium]